MRIVSRRLIAAFAAAGSLFAVPAFAAQCEPAGGFSAFLDEFRAEAASAGVSRNGIAALDGVQLDRGVIAFDRKVRAAFKGSPEQFIAQRVTSGRVTRARQELKKRADLFQRIEQRFGVPGEVIVAIWAMETDFGAVVGNKPIIPGLAALAYDCRRTDLFQRELLAALKIIDRGDYSASQLRGAGHGEIGQTQFLPSSFLRFAVDFDGSGHPDLIKSVPDVLASTANYLAGYGWQRGGSWEPGSANFGVLAGWNKSSNYQRAISAFASRVAGQS
jgi:lytic murein transglycosylase